MSETRSEVAAFEDSFDGLTDEFRVLDKIGEGTFSCVYRAIDLQAKTPQAKVVAVKKIHATSSPSRIKNELEVLAALQTSEYVCSVVTARRCRDQVIVVMPYFEFTDFRQMYQDCSVGEMRIYMRQLLAALDFTASRNVIHRDVKPTNFLYDRNLKRGVLVDFGLAEFYHKPTDATPTCPCLNGKPKLNANAQPPPQFQGGFRKEDKRPVRRANRAGTRGFRPPEVLLKCPVQNPKVDVWAAGVVLLMMLAHKFPFFTSMDDADALVELAVIYGRREMRTVALQHGQDFETNVPSITDTRISWQHIVDWCNNRPKRGPRVMEEKPLVDLLNMLMDLDVNKRPTAGEALQHPFFAEVSEEEQ